MSYLDLLLKIDSENATAAPAKTAKTPFVGFVRHADGAREVNSSAGVAANDAALSPRWLLHFADRDEVSVTFSPPVTRDEALRQYPDALAAIPVPDPPPPPRGCSACRHSTRFDNCGVPVEAGLAEVFQLAKHPAGGAGCAVFEARPIAAEHRVAALLAAGLLDQDDAALIRLRYDDDPDQWGQLLDAVERDAGRQA